MSPTRRRARARAAVREELRRLERFLNRHFRLRLPGVVLVTAMDDEEVCGSCSEVDGRFLILLDEGLLDCPRAAYEGLIHEWAHARERGASRREHGKPFGDAYWPIYSAWFDD